MINEYELSRLSEAICDAAQDKKDKQILYKKIFSNLLKKDENIPICVHSNYLQNIMDDALIDNINGVHRTMDGDEEDV